MGNISKHFNREEFACKCGCGYDTVDTKLIEVLENVREHFGEAVVITSGCRCEKHNASEGGSPKSQHLLGRATDFFVVGVPPKQVQAYLLDTYEGEHGLGCYDSFTHIDTRNYCARW